MTVAGIAVFLLVQIPIVAGVTSALPVLLALFGFFGTSGIVAYAGLTQRFPRVLAGRVNTAINLLVFVGGFLVQWGMGAVIGQWPADEPGRYLRDGYQMAFGLMLAAQTLSVAWFFVFRRNTVPKA